MCISGTTIQSQRFSDEVQNVSFLSGKIQEIWEMSGFESCSVMISVILISVIAPGTVIAPGFMNNSRLSEVSVDFIDQFDNR